MARHKVYLRALLLQRSNWLEEQVVETARSHGYGNVTPAMSRLFGNMGGRPAGLSELSRRMGISRQAVHKLANEAARQGLVEFVPAPQDARVVRVQFTQAGWAMSAQATRDFDELEERLRARLGTRNLAELKRLLTMPWTDDEAEACGERDSVNQG